MSSGLERLGWRGSGRTAVEVHHVAEGTVGEGRAEDGNLILKGAQGGERAVRILPETE